MSKVVYQTIIGLFRMNNGRIIDQELYSDGSDFSHNNSEAFLRKHKITEISQEVFPKSAEYFSAFTQRNIALTKQQVHESVQKDQLITQAIRSIEETDKVIHSLVKQLREWAGLYLPEVEHLIENNEKFVALLSEKEGTALKKEFKLSTTMGGNLEQRDVSAICSVAKQVQGLYALKEELQRYLTTTLETYAPNMVALLGVELTAQMIALAGSLKRLCMLPASTIQLLGAEKALFKHLTQKSKCPRHGIIVKHPFLANAKDKDHGKIARQLANALLLCIKLDYFKGDTSQGKLLRAKLEQQFKKPRVSKV